MQKAHLCEAISLFNRGTDDAVRGLEKLKKAQGFTGESYGDTLAKLEHARAQINLQFLADTEQGEKRDEARYERRPTN